MKRRARSPNHDFGEMLRSLWEVLDTGHCSVLYSAISLSFLLFFLLPILPFVDFAFYLCLFLFILPLMIR